MITFGFDDFDNKGQPIANGFKPDYKNNKPPITMGRFGYDLGNIPDTELFNQIDFYKTANKRVLNYDWGKIIGYELQQILLKPVIEIKEKYYLPIHIADPEFLSNLRTDNRYPNFTYSASDLTKGRCKVLVSYILESMTFERYPIDMFNSWAAHYNLPPNSIIVLSGSHDYGEFVKKDKAINHLTYNFWETSIHDYIIRFKHDLTKQMLEKKIQGKGKRDKVFLCYNRRLKHHRLKLVYRFKQKKLHNYGFISCGTPYDAKSRKQEILRETGDEEFTKSLPWTFDDRNLDYNHAHDFTLHDYLESYVHVVTESCCQDHVNTFFSEKIFKPIVGMQPFFLVSSPKALLCLRTLGYKTFSRWFDESYDDCFSLNERIEKIVNEIERLCSMTEEQLQTMMIEMLPTLQHNFETFKQRGSSNRQNLYRQLEDILYKS